MELNGYSNAEIAFFFEFNSTSRTISTEVLYCSTEVLYCSTEGNFRHRDDIHGFMNQIFGSTVRTSPYLSALFFFIPMRLCVPVPNLMLVD